MWIKLNWTTLAVPSSKTRIIWHKCKMKETTSWELLLVLNLKLNWRLLRLKKRPKPEETWSVKNATNRRRKNKRNQRNSIRKRRKSESVIERILPLRVLQAAHQRALLLPRHHQILPPMKSPQEGTRRSEDTAKIVQIRNELNVMQTVARQETTHLNKETITKGGNQEMALLEVSIVPKTPIVTPDEQSRSPHVPKRHRQGSIFLMRETVKTLQVIIETQLKIQTELTPNSRKGIKKENTTGTVLIMKTRSINVIRVANKESHRNIGMMKRMDVIGIMRTEEDVVMTVRVQKKKWGRTDILQLKMSVRLTGRALRGNVTTVRRENRWVNIDLIATTLTESNPEDGTTVQALNETRERNGIRL